MKKLTSAIILLTFYDAAVSNKQRLVTSVRSTTLLTPDELKALSNLKIPNVALCQELLNTQTASLHMPWWGHYCAELHDKQMGQHFNKHAQSNTNNHYYHPYYKQVLDKLPSIRSQLQRKQELLSELRALEV